MIYPVQSCRPLRPRLKAAPVNWLIVEQLEMSVPGVSLDAFVERINCLRLTFECLQEAAGLVEQKTGDVVGDVERPRLIE